MYMFVNLHVHCTCSSVHVYMYELCALYVYRLNEYRSQKRELSRALKEKEEDLGNAIYSTCTCIMMHMC